MDFIRGTRRVGRDQRFQSSNIGALEMQINRKRGVQSLFEDKKQENKRNHNSRIIREIKDKEYSSVLERLDKFSFNSSSTSTQTQTQSNIHQFPKFKPQKTKAYREDIAKPSNLFVTTTNITSSHPNQESQPKPVSKARKHYLSSSDEETPKAAVNTL